MAIVRKSFSDASAQPFAWTDEERSRLASLADTDINQAAACDPDARPTDEEALDRAVLGRRLRQLREKAGLNQAGFAEKYRIDFELLRDVEEGRVIPTSAFLAYLAVIEREPAAVARALQATVSAV